MPRVGINSIIVILRFWVIAKKSDSRPENFRILIIEITIPKSSFRVFSSGARESPYNSTDFMSRKFSPQITLSRISESFKITAQKFKNHVFSYFFQNCIFEITTQASMHYLLIVYGEAILAQLFQIRSFAKNAEVTHRSLSPN